VSRAQHGAAERRVSQVLAGVAFPAARWQLVMHAEEYGADAATRAQLWALRVRTYADLTAVLHAMGLDGAPVPTDLPRRPLDYGATDSGCAGGDPTSGGTRPPARRAARRPRR
jgi:hypothetical protein